MTSPPLACRPPSKIEPCADESSASFDFRDGDEERLSAARSAVERRLAGMRRIKLIFGGVSAAAIVAATAAQAQTSLPSSTSASQSMSRGPRPRPARRPAPARAEARTAVAAIHARSRDRRPPGSARSPRRPLPPQRLRTTVEPDRSKVLSIRATPMRRRARPSRPTRWSWTPRPMCSPSPSRS